MRNLPEKAEYIKENGLYVNTPKGNSMWPFIRGERDVISVIPVKEPLKKYQVILYEIPGRGHILHRILAVREHGYVVRGDNCFYKEYVSKDRVLGVLYKVLKDGKKERKVAGGTFPVRFWRWLYPLRWLWRKMRSAASKGKRKFFGPKG